MAFRVIADGRHAARADERSAQYHDLRLLDAAAQVWVDEARRYLALLASILGNDIPASKIPMHERVDLDARIGEHRSTMAALRDAHVSSRKDARRASDRSTMAALRDAHV